MFAVYDQLESAEAIARMGIEAAAEFDDGTIAGHPMQRQFETRGLPTQSASL